MEIASRFKSEMKLIPLGGKDHFWSADFLLAFALSRTSRVTNCHKRGEQNRNQDADDRDDDQQLNQSKTLTFHERLPRGVEKLV